MAGSGGTVAQHARRIIDARPVWKRMESWMILVAVTIAGWLLVQELRSYSWDSVVSGLEQMGGDRLWECMGLTGFSYLLLIGYDVLAVRAIDHPLPFPRVALASFTGFAVSYNFGPLLGGAPVRYRLYSSWGLPYGKILQLFLMMGVTFWVGAIALGGILFTMSPFPIPNDVTLPFSTVRPLGLVLLAVVSGYLALSFFARDGVTVFGRTFLLPSPGITAMQLLVAAVDLVVAAACLYVLIAPEISLNFYEFLGVYVFGVVVVLLTHVPGGAGVFELLVIQVLPIRCAGVGPGGVARLSGRLLSRAAPSGRDYSCRTRMATPEITQARSESYAPMNEREIETLRGKSYNATLVDVAAIHEQLRIIRVRPDAGVGNVEPGQYTVLGLGNWEPRIDGVAGDAAEGAEHPEAEFEARLTKRAYSLSCPLLDESGELIDVSSMHWYEFYVVLVPNASTHTPLLTPRLFSVSSGARLFVGPKATGHYSLERVGVDDDVLFIASGTGEAPHNAMIARLLREGHRGRIASVVMTRLKRDLGYFAKHCRLESQFPQYRYETLTTREAENLNESLPGYVGKRYVQNLLETGDLERDIGFTLNPQTSHVFLCGNPAMIGAPARSPVGQEVFPHPTGMIELLSRRGFVIDTPRVRGRLHFEKYWN